MKITVPLNYAVFFKEPRKSAWQSDFLIADHTLDVREVPKEDTEVAFRVGELPANDDAWRYIDKIKAYRMQNDTPSVVRVFDGQFYIERFPAAELETRFSAEPVGDRYDVESRSPIEGILRGPPRVHDEGRSQYRRVGYHYKTETRTQAQLEQEKGFELKRFTSYEAESRQIADELTKNFIIIGDMVFERVAEPVLRLIDGDRALVLVIDELPHDIKRAKEANARGTYGRSYTFGIDEYERACLLAEQFAAEQQKPFLKLALVDAVSPWDVTFRGENKTLYDVAQAAYEAICSSNDGHTSKRASTMATMTRQGAVAMYDLAMAVEQHAETSPALINAVRHIVTLAENLEPAQWFDTNALADARTYNSNRTSEYFHHEMAERINEEWRRLEDHLIGLRRALQCFDTKSVGKLDWTESMLDIKPTFRDHYRYVEVTNYHNAAVLSSEMGIDLTGAAADAALGRGNLFVIEDFEANRPAGAVYVSKTLDPADEPFAFEAKGIAFDRKHSDIILSMVKSAMPAKRNVVAEIQELTL